MKMILLVTTALMFASAAHAEPMCFAWVQKGDDVICDMRGSSDGRGQADATYRDAQSRNNAYWASRSTSTTSITYTRTRYRVGTRPYGIGG